MWLKQWHAINPKILNIKVQCRYGSRLYKSLSLRSD